MTGQPHLSCADQRWAQAMFAELQRQVDELSDQVRALANLVIADGGSPEPDRRIEHDDG